MHTQIYFCLSSSLIKSLISTPVREARAVQKAHSIGLGSFTCHVKWFAKERLATQEGKTMGQTRQSQLGNRSEKVLGSPMSPKLDGDQLYISFWI